MEPATDRPDRDLAEVQERARAAWLALVRRRAPQLLAGSVVPPAMFAPQILRQPAVVAGGRKAAPICCEPGAGLLRGTAAPLQRALLVASRQRQPAGPDTPERGPVETATAGERSACLAPETANPWPRAAEALWQVPDLQPDPDAARAGVRQPQARPGGKGGFPIAGDHLGPQPRLSQGKLPEEFSPEPHATALRQVQPSMGQNGRCEVRDDVTGEVATRLSPGANQAGPEDPPASHDVLQVYPAGRSIGVSGHLPQRGTSVVPSVERAVPPGKGPESCGSAALKLGEYRAAELISEMTVTDRWPPLLTEQVLPTVPLPAVLWDDPEARRRLLAEQRGG